MKFFIQTGHTDTHWVYVQKHGMRLYTLFSVLEVSFLLIVIIFLTVFGNYINVLSVVFFLLLLSGIILMFLLQVVAKTPEIIWRQWSAQRKGKQIKMLVQNKEMTIEIEK